jgi:phospholipid-binding lipoprotein MlaA
MTPNIRSAARRCALFAASGLALLALTACAPAPQVSGIHDPHEAMNRKFHAVNRAVDRVILRPASKAYAVLPQPVERGVANFANNLDTPGDVVNNLLQGRVGPAAQNSLRFATNVIFGLGGVFDTATALGLPGVETDFGETLHLWGAGEGAYVEVPFLGPSTTRDFAGTLVDLAANPVRLAVPQPEADIATLAKAGSRLGDRARYSETVDSVLYGSADSYAQLRLLYLQNRRFELGQTDGAAQDGGNDGFVDPYEDPYGQ